MMNDAATKDQIKSGIRRFLVDNFLMGQDSAELTDGASLLQTGTIDSTGVLELVVHLENEFQISITDEELLPENLDSIDHIVRFLQTKRGA